MPARQEGGHGAAAEEKVRGQALVEFTAVAVVFILLLCGVLELGRLWSAVQLLTAAARDGARTAAVTSTGSRSSAATSRVQSTASTYFAPSALTVSVTNGTTASGEPIVTVSARGQLRLLFGSLIVPFTGGTGSAVSIGRSATLRDEVTAGP